MSTQLAAELLDVTKNKSITEQLTYLSNRFADKIAFSTSFGYEDQLITHYIFTNNLPIKVFTLDTGRLFEETYKTFSKTLDKYNREIIVYFPDKDKVENLVTKKGPNSFYQSPENRKECCNIRKVIPLHEALTGIDCWITGLRKDQSDARAGLDTFEWDANFNLIKYSPLFSYTLQQVIDEINTFNVPYNVLHDKGFVSIGCAPCTRAIQPGEDFRAGRWWWEQNSKKECGLHAK